MSFSQLGRKSLKFHYPLVSYPPRSTCSRSITTTPMGRGGAVERVDYLQKKTVRSATPRRYSPKSLTTESFPEIHANVPIRHCEYDGVNPTEQAEKSDNEMLPIAVVFLFQAIMSIQLSPLPLFDQTLRKIARCLGKPGWKHSLQGCGAQDMKHSKIPYWISGSLFG